jgi:hypothetical protein
MNLPEPPRPAPLRLQTGWLVRPPAGAPRQAANEPGEARAGAPERAKAPPSYLARFVQAGEARAAGGRPSGLTIQAEALRAAVAAGAFENRAVFIDHAALLSGGLAAAHPSIERLAGVTQAARWDESAQAVEGLVRLIDTPAGELAERLLEELLNDPLNAPDLGLSLVFYPAHPLDPLQQPRQVQAIDHIESIDLVFEPAAGGRILAHSLAPAAVKSSQASPLLKGEQTMNEIQPGCLSAAGASAASSAPPEQAPAGGAPSEWQEAAAQAAVQAILSASGLPQAAQARLAAQAYPAPEALSRAIETERAYLASLAQTQVVQIGSQPPRSPQISGMRSGLDQVALALDALIAGTRPPTGIQPLSGVRELYHLLSGDYEMNGVFQPERIQFANVTSSSMASLVANALNKRVASEFAQYPLWWQPLVQEEDFASLQNISWITLGGIGELPTVAEGAAYTELSWDDKAESASFVKKGGYLGITLEAIDKDDTGRLRAAPRALAQAAWLTLSKTISAIFTSTSGAGPTLADSIALFHSSHSNVGSAALSISSYNAARLAMRKQTELNSGERLGALTAPRYLLVPPDLEVTALQVLASESDYTYALSNGVAAPVNTAHEGGDLAARMQFARNRVIVVDLWTDTNDWAAVCDPRMYPTIGVGYRYGRSPEIFSVASPTAGLMFTNDTMPVKARFFFAAGPIDYRGMYKANVA